MSWKPSLASLPVEKEMERKDLPEEDREEVRRFAEFLRRKRDKREGKELPPMPDGMKDWLIGKGEE